jgi:hypothetical protein
MQSNTDLKYNRGLDNQMAFGHIWDFFLPNKEGNKLSGGGSSGEFCFNWGKYLVSRGFGH